jgi:hypothetical protein
MAVAAETPKTRMRWTGLGDGGLVQEPVRADVPGLEAEFVEDAGDRC